MRSSSARSWGFFLALALALSWGTLSASAEEPPASESDGREKSSESELPISGSSEQATSESSSPEQAFERLLAEWESFEQAWLAFYPTLVRWGIEFDELPSYLKNLEKSWESEREARKDEAEASATKEAADAIEIADLTSSRDSEKRAKEGWRTAAVIGWLIAILGGAAVIIF